ncbi:Retrovirus-related Pol polyprotein from transposon RE2; Endonuclease RE2 [Eumeta japonica]|uniref:Retrovirus-related Pol polyprotein from transposon RE2 Endonuclease RE2 n=1 Tax=Eumeta variegata TaxID=151549 RepID=A0A4C1WQR4_EUMVA|nr:Retrovirus-related Pol polyprotein from transposon RE2; Endonuclease RE2 [Eumeta japonica]
MSECNPVKTPGEIQKKKTNYLINKEEIDNRFYREVIGALMYLVVGTRPDIANTVSRLAQFVNEPCQQDWLAVKRILRYLAVQSKGHPSQDVVDHECTLEIEMVQELNPVEHPSLDCRSWCPLTSNINSFTSTI